MSWYNYSRGGYGRDVACLEALPYIHLNSITSYSHFMNLSIVEGLVKKYQSIYRLMDWDIKIDINNKKNPTSLAESRWDYRNKIGMITFFSNCKDIFGVSLEKVVKHELSHAILSGIHSYMEALLDHHKINEAEFQIYQEFYLEAVCGHFERIDFHSK